MTSFKGSFSRARQFRDSVGSCTGKSARRRRCKVKEADSVSRREFIKTVAVGAGLAVPFVIGFAAVAKKWFSVRPRRSLNAPQGVPLCENCQRRPSCPAELQSRSLRANLCYADRPANSGDAA